MFLKPYFPSDHVQPTDRTMNVAPLAKIKAIKQHSMNVYNLLLSSIEIEV